MAFPTTHWSVLAAATLNGDPAGRAALATICAEYRAPVISFLRSRGHSPEAAEDLAQEFFVHLLESAAWKRADRARGRFRTFLLGALMHVLDHTRERAHAAKRGGGLVMESLDALLKEGFEPASIPAEAGRLFDREWALSLVESTLAALEDEFARDAQSKATFSVLKRFLPGAELGLSSEDAAQALGVPLATAKTWVHRLRQRFRERLRAAVALTRRNVGDALEKLRPRGTNKGSRGNKSVTWLLKTARHENNHSYFPANDCLCHCVRNSSTGDTSRRITFRAARKRNLCGRNQG